MKYPIFNTLYTTRCTLYAVIRSTTVENSLQINPFYAKQSQCQVSQNQPKYFVINEIRKNGQLVIQTKQTQFKANKAKNKPNLGLLLMN